MVQLDMVRHLFFLVFLYSFQALSLGSFTVVHSGNRAGEIEPCGCKVHQTGGLNRLAHWMEMGRKKGALAFLDSGDTFFSSQAPPPLRAEFEKKRAIVLAESFKEMGLTAMAPGDRDLAFGVEFLRELQAIAGTQILSANLTDKSGKLLFPAYQLFEWDGVKVGVVGISAAEAFANLEGIETKPTLSSLREAIEKVKKEGAQANVILSHSGLAMDREIQKIDPEALVLGAHSLDSIVENQEKASGAIFQEEHEGKQIGVAIFEKGKWTKKELVDLTTDLDKKNNIRKRMDAFREQIASETEKKVPLKKSAEKPFVAHPHLCKTCHEEQYTFWENTKHASAILVLYAKKMHKSPECIGCHSLGFREGNGFGRFTESISTKKVKEGFAETLLKEVFAGDSVEPLDSRTDEARFKKLHQKYAERLHFYEEKKEISKNYLGVQCEHCHGNRNGHPGNLGKVRVKVSEESCKKCHRPPNAPGFESSMIQKVACPLMKRN